MEKVLFLVKAREFGGLEVLLLDWLSGVDCSKASVALCCYGTETLRQKLACLKMPIESIPLSISDSEPFWKTFPKWLRLFSSIQPNTVVILESVVGEFDVIPVLAARLSARGQITLFEASWGRSLSSSVKPARKLHYGFLPGIGLHRYKEMFKQRLRGRLAHRTLVVSQAVKDNLTAEYGYPAGRTSVLYHGVDTNRFQASRAERIEYRRAHKIPEDATVIVSHGRLAPKKRIDRILKAFAVLSPEYENLWMLLTCYGPLKEDVENTVASSGAYRRVKLIGFQEDSSRILKASDIYILSSDDEGFGIALVEALSTELVCVATSGAGPRDIITDRENGFLVEPNDEDILLGLRRALSLDLHRRERLVRQARKTVEEKFEIRAAICRALEATGIPHR
jgi:glycosyltransferase involved in cell wall biosynthesis